MSGFNFDPFKSTPFASFGNGNRAGKAAARPEYRQPLDPEPAQAVGTQVLNAGKSGVRQVLGALDKPGDAVRGVLAGKGASSLKNLIPFSDAMGVTGAKDHTSGRDLTDTYGITSKHDKGWGAWGAGLAADLATDPLSYATFGAKSALTPIGRAVSKTGALKGFTGQGLMQGFHGVEPAMLAAGNTASDVAHAVDQGQKIAKGSAAATGVQAGQPLSSLLHVGLPFGGPGVNVGTGQMAQRIAGGLDKAGDFVRYGNPVGRAVGSLFDHSVHGAVDKITQQGAAKYLDPSLRALKAQGRTDRAGLIGHLDPLVSAKGADEIAINNAARASAEGITHRFTPAMISQVAPAGAHVQDIGKRQIAEVRAAGGTIKDLADPYANYVHRSAFPESAGSLQMGGGRGKTQGLLSTTSGANIGREDVLRGVPGGTERINDWASRFAGIKKDRGPVISAIKADLVGDLQKGGHQLTPAIDKAFDEKAIDLAGRFSKIDPAHRTTADATGTPFFSPDLVSDVTQRGNQHAGTVSHVNTAIGIMADNARKIAPGNAEGLVPLHVLARQLGLTTYKADQATGSPMEGALVQLYKGLAQQGAGKVDPYLMGKMGPLRKAVGGYGLTPEHAEQLTKAYGKWAAPEQTKASLGAFDSATNAFKALAYPVWLPSHVRNAVTAGVNNLRHGVGIGDYADQLKAMTGRGARDLSGIHPSLAGLPPAQQVEALRKLQYGSANIYGGAPLGDQIVGNVRDALSEGKRFTPQVPGSNLTGPTGSVLGDAADLTLKKGLLGSLAATGRAAVGTVKDAITPGRKLGQSIGDNLGIKGVGGAGRDTLPAVAAGRAVGSNVEDFFRGALWNKLARTGHTPEQAAAAIDKLHFDYDALTGFEKNVMRRAMPFYTFQRKNLPLQVNTLLHRPGIIQAQGKPFTQPTPGSDGYVPKYLDGGFATPIGPEVDGKRQYISKLGLPAEDAFEKFHFQNGLPDVWRTALAHLGGLNPLIKGPAEQLFDTQFHTQRKLSDLKAQGAASAIGKMWNDDNPQLLAQVMANSPLTRFVSQADKLADPRKSLWQKAANLATGVKVTDVDVAKQRAIDSREALSQILSQHPSLSQYHSFYVKPGTAQNLTPEEVQLMRLYATQQQASREYNKAQRIGVQGQ